MFILMLPRIKPLSSSLNNEKGWTIGRIGQNGVEVCNATIGDKLFLAVDLVPHDVSLLI